MAKAEVKICRKEAEKQIQQFKDFWGFEDPKSITSNGKDSSIPEDVKTLFISNIMTGNTEVVDGGKTIRHTLREKAIEKSVVVFNPRRLKQHEIRAAQATGTTEEEIISNMVQTLAELTPGEYSELTGKDVAALSAIAMHLLFI